MSSVLSRWSRVRSETQSARAREWGEHVHAAPPYRYDHSTSKSSPVSCVSSPCRLCRVHTFILTLYLLTLLLYLLLTEVTFYLLSHGAASPRVSPLSGVLSTSLDITRTPHQWSVRARAPVVQQLVWRHSNARTRTSAFICRARSSKAGRQRLMGCPSFTRSGSRSCR